MTSNTLQDSANPIEMALFTRLGVRRFSTASVAFVRWGLCVVVALQLCGQAHGSCGDYLEHSPTQSGTLQTNFQGMPLNSPAEAPAQGRCRNGNCRSQVPVNLPTHDKVRWDDRRSDMNISLCEGDVTAHQQFANAVDENLSSQAVLEVLVPPPRS
jgi:hypothetical protein